MANDFTIGGNVKGSPQAPRVNDQAHATIRRDLSTIFRGILPQRDIDEAISYAQRVYSDRIEDGWMLGIKLDPYIRAVLGRAWKLRKALRNAEGFPPERVDDHLKEINKLCIAVE